MDGIRHAVEIIELAYIRLSETLTSAALNPPSSSELPKLLATALLDAWSIVDAIDRFRMLCLQIPGISFPYQQERKLTPLEEVAKPFRDLRIVADHLAQRSDL